MKQVFVCNRLVEVVNGIEIYSKTWTDDENFARMRDPNYKLASLADLNESLDYCNRFDGVLLTSDGLCVVVDDGVDENDQYQIGYLLLEEAQIAATTF